MTHLTKKDVRLVADEDGRPGCPVTVWDGPYRMRCSLGASVARCAYHGPFEAHEARPTPPTPGRPGFDFRGRPLPGSVTESEAR